MSAEETSAPKPAADGQSAFEAAAGLTDEELIRKALASSPAPSKPSRIRNALTFGWRGMLKIKHVPEQLLDVTLTPVMFTLMFTYLFGGAIAGSTGAYLQYILPGLLVMSVLFTTVYSGVALNTDKTRGRRRPLPLDADLGALAAAWRATRRRRSLRDRRDGDHRPRADPRLRPRQRAAGGILGALALVTLFSFALSWAFTTLGLLLRSPNAVMNAGFMAIFPLTFLSNVFVDPDTLPAGLEAFVDHNPISYLSDCARGLMDGTVDGTDLTIVIATGVLLVAVFAPITARLYARG